MFSILFGALCELRNCEITGEVPFVDWGGECAYYEEGSGNCWESFFPQTGTRDPSGRVAVVAGWDDIQPYGGMDLFSTLVTLVAKYARPVPRITSQADLVDVSECVGIHYRGTDKKATQEFAGPDPEVFCAHALDACKRMGIKRVFVATDCAKALEVFRGWASSNNLTLVCTDSIRSHNQVSIHNHYGRQHGSAPGLYGTRKGEEVLVDAILLSRCQHLVRSPSGVSLYALLMNPRLTFECLGELYGGHRWETFLLDRPEHTRMGRHVTFSPGMDGRIYEVVREKIAGRDLLQYVHEHPPEKAHDYVWITTLSSGPTVEQRAFMEKTKAPSTLFAHGNAEMHLIGYIMDETELNVITALIGSCGVQDARRLVDGKMILTLPDEGALFVACSRNLFEISWRLLATVMRGEVKVGEDTYDPGDRGAKLFMAIASVLAANMSPLPK